MLNLTNAEILEAYKSAERGIRKSGAKMGRAYTADQIADMTQTVMIKVCESFDPSKGTAAQLAYTAGTRVAMDFSFGKGYASGSKDLLAVETTDEDGNVASYDMPCSAPNALAQMLHNEKLGKVERALAKLPPSQRAVISIDLEGDRALTNAERQAKFKAIDNLQEEITR